MTKQRFDTGEDDAGIAVGATLVIAVAILALAALLWKVAHP